MAKEITELTGKEVELIKGSGGIFEILVDDRVIFTKWETGRFPDPGEIGDLVTALK